MKGQLIQNYDSKINDYFYKKGQIIEVTELDHFPNNYAVYRYDTLDWVPKKIVKII